MTQSTHSDTLILRKLQLSIENELRRVGIFSRVFGRIKEEHSLIKKLEEKRPNYIYNSKKMQDYFGIRVGVYFFDDIYSARQCVNLLFTERSKDSSIDELKTEVFGPTRYNVVYDLPKDLPTPFTASEIEPLIDTTFEVQFRSMLSEGWHEIEHDFRYKCKSDWNNYLGQSRSLNGIYATLENCDISMIKLFEELAYMEYKSHNYSSAIRNLFRLRFKDKSLSSDATKFVESNPNFAKQVININRSDFMKQLIKSRIQIPLIYDNVLFLANRLLIKNDNVKNLEPAILSEIFEDAGY